MSDANYYASLTPKPPKKRGARIVILITSLLVVVPVAIKEIPREQARWHEAAAKEYLEQDKLDLALQQASRAIALDPRQYSSHVLKARIYERRLKTEKSKNPDEDLKKALECIVSAREATTQDGQQLFVELQAAALAHNVGLWKVAAEQYKKLLEMTNLSGYLRAQLLNGFAYNAALANVDLDAALADVDEALDLISDQRSLDDDELAEAKAQILDTRGYVRYRRGEYTAALGDVEQSLQLFGPVRSLMLKKAEDDLVRANEIKRMKDEINRTWAVLLYHRMLINEELGLQEPQRFQIAAKDEGQIKALGYTPGPDLY